MPKARALCRCGTIMLGASFLGDPHNGGFPLVSLKNRAKKGTPKIDTPVSSTVGLEE